MDEHHHRDGGAGELPAVDPQGRPYVGTPRITETTRTRLVSRTCGWCGEAVPYSGKGRPPQYCGKAHRNRAWEVRSARRRQERDQAAGTARSQEEPVREVVRETVTRTSTRSARVEVRVPGPERTVQVPVEVPVRVEVERPVRLESAAEVCAVLSGVEAAVRAGRMPDEGLDHVLRRAVALVEAIQDFRGWED